MSYVINNTRGQIVAVVADGTINTAATPVTLVGRGVTSYGEYENENYVWLLENFANSSAPPNAILGQLWYDSTAETLKFYNASNAWSSVASTEYVNNQIASGSTNISATGNITGGNLLTGGSISATGGITGGSISVSGNITGTNIHAVSQITADTITANTIIASGSSSAFRLPNLTQTQINALTAQNGDMVYNTTDDMPQVYQNGSWISFTLSFYS